MARRGGATSESDQTITVRDVARLLRRGAVLSVLAAVAAGAAGYWASSTSPAVYSAEVGVIASQPGAQYSELNIITPPVVDAGVYQSAILEGNVVVEALTRLEGEPPSGERLRRFLRSLSVRVEDAQRSSTVWIDVRNESPSYAADAVNLIAEELIIWDRDRARRALDRSVAALDRAIVDLDAEIAAAREAGDQARLSSLQALRDQRQQELTTALQTSATTLVVGLLEPLREARAPEEPVGPRVLFTTVVASLLGLVLGYAIQVLRTAFDTRVGGRDEVMEETGLPVLAEFPAPSGRSDRLSPEAAGFFHTNVVLATRGASPRIIAVTCPTRLYEKSGVAMSLAENFARSGQKTLLIDADLRHPGVTERLDLVRNSASSLDAYLVNRDATFVPVSVAIGGHQSFDFVPSFTSERFPVELLNEGFQASLEQWADDYDVIVLDSAPVVPFADTLAIAPGCTGLVLCVSATRSRREQVDDALEILGGAQVPVLGIALTDVRTRSERREGADSRRAHGSDVKTGVPMSRVSTRSDSRRIQ